jgi:hypothetical protein
MTVVRDYVRARRERVPTPLYGRASVRVTLCSLVVGRCGLYWFRRLSFTLPALAGAVSGRGL